MENLTLNTVLDHARALKEWKDNNLVEKNLEMMQTEI